MTTEDSFGGQGTIIEIEANSYTVVSGLNIIQFNINSDNTIELYLPDVPSIPN